MPLSFFYIYIGASVESLSQTLRQRGSFWEKAEIYFFIITIVLFVMAIRKIWGWVAQEVGRFEQEFDDAHPNGFNLKRAKQIELERMERERVERERLAAGIGSEIV